MSSTEIDKHYDEEKKPQPVAPIPRDQLESISFVRPDGVSRCTWKPGIGGSPHGFQPHTERAKISPNVLDCVGNTPLIKLNHIPKSFDIKCEMLAKCEFFNPAGSVKDRIALRMIEDAEQKGLLKPGYTIIEPTSGNTGLGLAMASAVKGYRCIIVMPLKMSDEKVNALKVLGAEIVRTPTECSFDSPDGLIAVAQKISKSIPNSIILDQYRNPFNPIAHYEHTAEEILMQCDGKIDVIVCAAGTGGTITGIGRKIKDACPDCKIIAADPYGSILAEPEELNQTDTTFYEVEGIGYDFIPTVLDRSIVDKWYKTTDEESFPMARRLIREEGLLCGGSSGSAMSVAIQYAKTMSEGERLVVLLPDGMRNYMTKFISDNWMKVRNFELPYPPPLLWWSDLQVSMLKPAKIPVTMPDTIDCIEAVGVMEQMEKDFLFLEHDGEVAGVVTSHKILLHLSEGKVRPSDPISKVVTKLKKFTMDDNLEQVADVIEKDNFALINLRHDEDKENPGCWRYVSAKELVAFVCRKECNVGTNKKKDR